MKRVTFIVVVCALALAAAGCSVSRSAVTSEADMVTAEHVDAMLARCLYKIDFDRVYPISAPSFHLNNPYYISVIEDRVESFLPYFGRAYSVPYGGGEGLRFTAPISGYSESVRKNGSRDITFEARTEEDLYRFILTVFPLGQCNLNVMSGQKQAISFSGQMDLEPEFEAVKVE